MIQRDTHSLALALALGAARLAECAAPILQNKDNDAHSQSEEEEFKITIGIIVIIAVFGIGIAFFVGYYVGMTTTRKAPVQVRSTHHAAADVFTATPLPAPPLLATLSSTATPLAASAHRQTSAAAANDHADSALSSYVIKRGRTNV